MLKRFAESRPQLPVLPSRLPYYQPQQAALLLVALTLEELGCFADQRHEIDGFRRWRDRRRSAIGNLALYALLLHPDFGSLPIVRFHIDPAVQPVVVQNIPSRPQPLQFRLEASERLCLCLALNQIARDDLLLQPFHDFGGNYQLAKFVGEPLHELFFARVPLGALAAIPRAMVVA